MSAFTYDDKGKVANVYEEQLQLFQAEGFREDTLYTSPLGGEQVVRLCKELKHLDHVLLPRIAACVRACVGMHDPEKEIQAMKDRIEHSDFTL